MAGFNIIRLVILAAGQPPSNVWIANTNHFQNRTTNQLISNVSDFNARFNTGFLEHNVLTGLEISREDREQARINFNDAYRINVANPNPYVTGTLAPTTAMVQSSANTIGVYAQDQIKITKWLELMGEVRFDNYTANATTYTLTRATGAQSSYLSLDAVNNFVTYRAGVVVHPTENSSVYYMHGTLCESSG